MRHGALAAFTILEMMVVIAITGVLAAIAVPDMVAVVQRERANTEAAKIAAGIERGRNRSRTLVCRTVVTVDKTAGTVTLAPSSTDPDVSCRTLSGAVFKWNTQLVTVGDLTINGVVTSPFVFDSAGGFSGTARAILPMQLSGKRNQDIHIWPAIGTVRIVK